jgi:hypothetical protein
MSALDNEEHQALTTGLIKGVKRKIKDIPLTDWFGEDGRIMPTIPGVYQVATWGQKGKPETYEFEYAYWNGVDFMARRKTVYEAYRDRHMESTIWGGHTWRGLAEDPMK